MQNGGWIINSKERSSVDKQAANLVLKWDEEEEANEDQSWKQNHPKSKDSTTYPYATLAGPDQWYQGPLEVFKETEEGFNTSAQRDTLPDPTLEDPWEEETKEK